ncbi:isoaspartyl peptidase/L-asparaginase-like [Oppia nitens]|uniref:isoaspartyl peptidase/L-asparaginase-like n=1 Tax=Oppia nitens TaxID=1686743 RepID=UPI0023DC103B|nr:isoaspartyl peptidase/L-asparaginase-like [Oppia nitens]
MIIVVHGGAAKCNEQLIALKLAGVKRAVKEGYDSLANGSTALDAVERAVSCMENDPIMNCGYGSSLTDAGTVECDAIIMDGQTLKSGAVAGVQHILHPISLSRAVMDRSDHCLFIGSGAEQFAQEVGIELVTNESLIHEFAQKRLKEYKTFARTIDDDKPENQVIESESPKEHDTVGSVAIDQYGNCAVATSTGGITGKRVGRVGDSPIIGAGGYADNSCGAVSTTGHGEAIMRTCLSRHIMYELISSVSLQDAVDKSLQMMAKRVDGYGGAIAVAPNQKPGIGFTTPMMSWAYIDSNDSQQCIHYGIRVDEHLTQNF